MSKTERDTFCIIINITAFFLAVLGFTTLAIVCLIIGIVLDY